MALQVSPNSSRRSHAAEQVKRDYLPFLCTFSTFIHDPVPNDWNGLCIISHTGVTATEETSVVNCIGFHRINSSTRW